MYKNIDWEIPSTTYFNIERNGALFPLYILNNYNEYKINNLSKSTCEEKNDIRKLRIHQEFINKFLDPETSFRWLLLYHGLGWGKTIAIINLFNIVFSKIKNININILLKANLKDDPWIKDIKLWFDKKEFMNNINFINYDWPNSYDNFISTVNFNSQNMYVIEEMHNFISSVKSNIKNENSTQKSLKIYNFIMEEKKIKPDTYVILISGTPIISEPFELWLIFNLLRPNIFPLKKNDFNYLFLNNNLDNINLINKNMFIRRIIGLVSFFDSNDPILFAKKNYKIRLIEMSNYQKEIYEYYENFEKKKRKNAWKYSKTSVIYSRLSCNFVFPNYKDILGKNRFNTTEIKYNKKNNNTLIEYNDDS